MREDMTREDLYNLRRKNMRQILNFGDIKILAKKLLDAYPDISKSGQRDFANYLAQILNLKSKRAFKEELARRIESVWPSLVEGQLDLTEEEMQLRELNEAIQEQSKRIVDDDETILNIHDKNQRDLQSGRKEDSIMPSIAKDALKWRLVQKFAGRDIEITEDVKLEVRSGKFIADIVVMDKVTRKILAIAETGQFVGGLSRLKKKAFLEKLIKETNVNEGVLAIYDGTDVSMSWFSA